MAQVIDWRCKSIHSGMEKIRRCARLLGPDQAERIERLLEEIEPLLQSKPERAKNLAETLIAAAQHPQSAGIVAVLASPTAEHEFVYFLQFAEMLREHLEISRLDVLLLRWENLVEAATIPAVVRQCKFNETAARVGVRLEEEGWRIGRLYPVNVTVGTDQLAHIEGPPAFSEIDAIVREAAECRTASKETLVDLDWTANFYARQRSLSSLGPRQSQIDLAIRKEIGRVVSSGRLWNGHSLSNHRICLTSELIARLAKCYRLRTASFNISVGNS